MTLPRLFTSFQTTAYRMDSPWDFPPSCQYGDNDKTLEALIEDSPSNGAEPLSSSFSSFIDLHCYGQYPEAPAGWSESNLVTSAPHTWTLTPPLQAASAAQSAAANRCGPTHGTATRQLDPDASDIPIPVRSGTVRAKGRKPNSPDHGASRSKYVFFCQSIDMYIY